MRCVKPFVTGKAAYGCGQCMPCRFNRQRVWYHRILLEGLCHAESCFVTLTFREEALPSDRSVCPETLRNWLKRLRRSYVDRRLRYFAVGEYGDLRGRPHYHAIVYGIRCHQGPYEWSSGLADATPRCACDTCERLRKSWPFGFVSVSALNVERAKYISGYLVKKMTSKDDPRLVGRHPEFARMSTHPGLGHDYLWTLASAMLKYNLPLVKSVGHGGKSLPLGRYLRRKLATYADVPVPDYKDTSLLNLRSLAWANGKSVSQVYEELWSEYSAFLSNKVRIAGEKKQTQAVTL